MIDGQRIQPYVVNIYILVIFLNSKINLSGIKVKFNLTNMINNEIIK